jgi:hypothetical protein
MFSRAPRFPAFETWKGMSETEQDALLARMEKARRRRSIIICAALAAGAALACIAVALHIGSIAWR